MSDTRLSNELLLQRIDNLIRGTQPPMGQCSSVSISELLLTLAEARRAIFHLTQPAHEPLALPIEVPAQHRVGTEPLSRVIGDLRFVLSQINPKHQAHSVLSGAIESLRTAQPPPDLLAAGDRLAHELVYRHHIGALDAWWSVRGGHDKCTVCNAQTKSEYEGVTAEKSAGPTTGSDIAGGGVRITAPCPPVEKEVPLVADKAEGTEICRFCYFTPDKCICNAGETNEAQCGACGEDGAP